MKQYKYLCLALASAVALLSCNKNEPATFNDKDAFVAFDKASFTIAENSADTLRIPVTLASVKGLEQTIRFEIIDPEKKAAVKDVNYELVTASGVLSFDAEHRTQYIEIRPIYYSEYTGDLSISIVLHDGETIGAGSDNTCSVTISDVDHPLAFMLGAYTATGVSYFNGPTTWTMTLVKDKNDDHLVWIDNIFADSSWASDDMMYYGTVNAEKTILTIPFGQESEYKYGGNTPVQFFGRDSDVNLIETGAVEAQIIVDENGVVTLDFGDDYGWCAYIAGAGNINIIMPGVTAVRN